MRGTIRPSDWAGDSCPECGQVYVGMAALAAHRSREHGARSYSARRDPQKAVDKPPSKVK